MNTSNVILAAKANSGKSTNNVWVVYTSDNSSDKMYCTSAYKAMRLAFLLKKRLGLNISDNCLARLSQEIAKAKGATAPTAQEVQIVTSPHLPTLHTKALCPSSRAEQRCGWVFSYTGKACYL